MMNPDLLSKEVVFKSTRSSGPGGQNVNKLDTKVELRFDLLNSQSLDEADKRLIQERLAPKMTNEGIIILTNQHSRSQLANKEKVLQQFLSLIEKALIPPKKRKKVKTLVANPVERLQSKRQHSEKKSLRQKVQP